MAILDLALHDRASAELERAAAVAAGSTRASLDSLSTREPGPEESFAAAEQTSRLWRWAASLLTTEQLTTLWLFYVEEMPLEEVARVLGRTPARPRGCCFAGGANWPNRSAAR